MMIVAGLQLDIAWEDPAENFRRTGVLVREAVDRGARVLALPELFATGFSMRSEEMAARAAEVRAFLANTAVGHGVWVIGGQIAMGGRVAFVSWCLRVCDAVGWVWNIHGRACATLVGAI